MAISFRTALAVILSLSAVIAFYTIFTIYDHDKESSNRQNLITSDEKRLARGKDIFDSKCRFCHNAYSTEKRVGPGLKGILKNARLPFSNRPSTPENILRQLKNPVDSMPAFKYLSEEETSDVLAFLYSL